MAEMLELSHQKLKINVIIVLKALMEKVINLQECMGNVSRQIETKKESKANGRNQKHYNRNKERVS